MSETKFTKSHEWIEISGDIGTVGITQYAQEQLGDVVFVELPEAGKQIKTSDEVAVVESVKAASEIYSPVTGEIIEVNNKLQEDPSVVNSSPQEDGWFVKIKLKDPKELAALLDKEEYIKEVSDL